MRKAFRVLGVITAVVVTSVWLAAGANRGWTKTTTSEMLKDPVTEIEYPGPRKTTFSPGIEVLGSGWALAVVFVIASFFIKSKTN
jgi:hypothetical protein